MLGKIPTSSPIPATDHPTTIPTGDSGTTTTTSLATTSFSTVFENPYFSAGLGLFGVGTVAAISRKSLLWTHEYLKRACLVTLEIPSKDKAFQWVLHWLSKHQPSLSTSKMPQPTTTTTTKVSKRWSLWPNLHQWSLETSFKQHDHGATTTQFAMVPGLGHHWIQYKGVWMKIHRQRDTKMIDLHNASPWETISMTTLRSQSSIFSIFLEDAKQHAMAAEIGKTVIYTSYGPEWRVFGAPRKKRPLESVILDDGIKEKIVSDLKQFLDNWKWYNERGIPYRRGYLLHGPPGSGKSSFIQALAGELEYNICILNLSERGLTDDRLNHLMTVLPSRSMLLLEDADAAFLNHRQFNDKHPVVGVTFSGLLNALDGVAAAEERVIFMTTNHLDRLDPALTRPGRMDVQVLLTWASLSQKKNLFLRFYQSSHYLNEYIMKIESKQISMANLQGHFICFRDDPLGAIQALDQLEEGK